MSLSNDWRILNYISRARTEAIRELGLLILWLTGHMGGGMMIR